jgi:hypothetical protein
LAALAGAGLLWQTSSEAGGSAFEPQVTAFQKDQQLQVAVVLTRDASKRLSGELTVELVGPAGERLAIANKTLNDADPLGGHRLDLAAEKGGGKRTLRVRFAGRQADIPLASVLLAKAHETSLTVGQDFHAGSTASLSCDVHGVRSLTEMVPLAGSEVVVRLRDKSGKGHDLYKGLTGATGKAEVQFAVPDVEAGPYTLEVVTRSALGEEKVERPVRVQADAKVLLVSDRPIYQPGHVIHLRALVLRPFDLRPVEGKDILFEVEDPKGNKVFKRSFKTSGYGVASVDFQLADEVNMGDYHLRAVLGEARAEKTVQVKRYVLPKFKVEVKADKAFYLPKETLKLELQSDYFFGKPVSGAKVEVIASTFDVAFNKFHSWKGQTDENGHAKLEIPLPDHFVGQPLQKGDALVKLDVKVLDTADHTEVVTRSYPVSDQPIRVSLIAEGGKVVPDMDNRIFVAATYPDGSPAANCDIKLWHEKLPGGPQPGFGPGGPVPMPLPPGPPKAGGKLLPVVLQADQPGPKKDEPKAEPLATIKTNAAGLAEFKVRPKADQLRADNWGQKEVELLGGKQMTWGPQIHFDLRAVAKDPKGSTATAHVALNSQPMGENVLLRLDKAIYQAGDRLAIDVRTSAGLPTVFVDIVRGGQIMLSKWLEVKDGKALQTLDLPQSVFGSLEVHAYQMLQHGEIIRDSRVVYVQPRTDLKVTVQAGKSEYAPGEDAMIRFIVTDAQGKPAPAALGVIVVDEAVYALQDLQPGLEKVYFTLQEELLKPQVQVKFSPNDSIDNLVLQPALPAPKQQVAEVLLTSVKLPAPKRLVIDPVQDRKKRVEGQVVQVGAGLFNYAWQQNADAIRFDKTADRWVFRPGLLDDVIKANLLPPQALEGTFGGKLTLDDLAALQKDFTPDALGKAITAQRLQQVVWNVAQYVNQNQQRFQQGGQWVLPANLVQEVVEKQKLGAHLGRDAWGEPLRLVRLEKKAPNPTGQPVFDQYEIISAGPDRKLGSADDLRMRDAFEVARFGWPGGMWWMGSRRLAELKEQAQVLNGNGIWRMDAGAGFGGFQGGFGGPMPMPGPGGGGGGFGGGGPPRPMAAMAPGAAPPMAKMAEKGAKSEPSKAVAGPADGKAQPAGAEPARVREFFPETMLWQPSLITDDKGEANLAVNFADSITTWRLSASANSKGGALGGATVPLKVFQDFFVDIDLPVFLTQGDEVAFPVAVYNYLKTPQTVKIELQKESWFELIDDGGLVRSLDVKPNEVTSVKYRIRAAKIGVQPLTVKALGSKQSDAVKRTVEVTPNGQKVEKVFTDRLNGKVSQTVEVPDDALPDASKLMVKVYPGAMAQVVEGLDGMLRMPNGCFEQTSSSAYPNVLIVDYIKKNRLASPQLLMKCENYLNVGYQRLLTFERPGGGFDWWGREEPLIWLSAYGLQEFSDMARVYPIDRGIIDRTQAFLMKKRDADGTWSNIGATHGETIANMGNPKLLLTSYVTWSLVESGYDRKQLTKSVQFIRDGVKQGEGNAYILALAANALAAYDAKDDSTLEAVRKLDQLRKELPDWKAINFPAKGVSLTYAHGDGATVETTALAALAMLKTGQFNNSVNQALTYLVKAKHGNGTWGSTQATILALKALIAATGANQQKGTTNFTVLVNGQEAARGKVDEENADMMQAFDLKGVTRPGTAKVEIAVDGETNLMYQVVGRYYLPWKKDLTPQKPAFDLSVSYDRTKLATNDLLHAKATLRYNGKLPTYMVMLDLGIAPGFTVDAGDFAEMVNKNKVKRFEITARQVILYLGDVRPGEELHFEYTLKAKYPLRAQTPASVAYEYNTPANRVEAAPVELTVTEKK